MLTQPDFNLMFLFLPCGFLSLPCSVSSLGFMSYMLIILPGLGSSIIWAPVDGWSWVAVLPTPEPPAICRNRLLAGTGPAGKRKGSRAMGCPFLSIILEVHLLSPHNFSSAQKDPPKVQCEDEELQKTAAASVNHQELALLITGFGELPRTLQ